MPLLQFRGVRTLVEPFVRGPPPLKSPWMWLFKLPGVYYSWTRAFCVAPFSPRQVPSRPECATQPHTSSTTSQAWDFLPEHELTSLLGKQRLRQCHRARTLLQGLTKFLAQAVHSDSQLQQLFNEWRAIHRAPGYPGGFQPWVLSWDCVAWYFLDFPSLPWLSDLVQLLQFDCQALAAAEASGAAPSMWQLNWMSAPASPARATEPSAPCLSRFSRPFSRSFPSRYRGSHPSSLVSGIAGSLGPAFTALLPGLLE